MEPTPISIVNPATHEFILPVKYINSPMQVEEFKVSSCYKEFMTFVMGCQGAVKGLKISDVEMTAVSSSYLEFATIVRYDRRF
jgi:hypothetical protein